MGCVIRGIWLEGLVSLSSESVLAGSPFVASPVPRVTEDLSARVPTPGAAGHGVAPAGQDL
jgi:hypothetical protein